MPHYSLLYQSFEALLWKYAFDSNQHNMKLGDSIRGGAKWLLAGNLGGQLLQFAFGIVLARLLVPADFGLLVTVQIYTGLAGFIASGGTGQALVRAKTASLKDFHVVFTIQLFFGLAIYTGFFLMAPVFARWYNEPIYSELFRVSALSFILRPFRSMPDVWLTREMRFKQRTIVRHVCGTLGAVLSVVLALHKFGVWSLVFGGLASAVLAIFTLYSITPVRPGLRFDAALARELGLYGFKFTSNEIVSYIRQQTPNFYLGRTLGPAIVGLFNKADSLARVPRILATSAYDPVFRALAATQDNVDRSQYIYLRTVTLFSVYMVPLFLGIYWLAHPFITFVYGQKWVASAAPLAILSLAGPFACIDYASGAVLAARNWLGREFFVQLIRAALYAAASIIGIRWGLAGIAWGILLAEGISAMAMAYLVTQCLRTTFSQLARSLIPGLGLNAVLVATLLCMDAVLPNSFSTLQPFAYMLVIAASGGLMYVAGFLFAPIPALASEAARWKELLHLPSFSRQPSGR